ncbi:threonine synthase [Niabella drilacis]|uniref:Threonine synthase n=1 Tax=Niabella drilacis (strain DSM 25811 / CCM 8410 / CCUG 62505 / LMG 26954 / E90) TaxID=1285928 RepID=A0A1G6T554_NIADE|nr:threonine synthase [Niabella drilacis]SDD24083.1 threonine synthase [Niabella drilacis]
MHYYSLNHQSSNVTFKEATIKGQAPDKGLYFPESLPRIDADLIRNIESLPEAEIAFRVIRPYVGAAIPEAVLFDIVSQTVNFPFPLKPVTNSIASLELFHGPTLAFKDVGARFMSRCLGYFLKDQQKEVTVLVATSGDTGGAVASGFYDVEGVQVVILYPKGRVSPVQEKQLTALGKNITALEVAGSFDDCQRLVKQAFTDDAIRAKRFLTSANSINVARWLPQQFYYFFAYKQWQEKGIGPVVSVPSGNFGNICAGLLAKVTGLPLGHFIAACNANDVVPGFLQTENWQPKKAVATLSNAMDVGDPSNFVRIMELFGRQFLKLKEQVSATSISDADTIATIKAVFAETGYTLDPHGAVAYRALENYQQTHPGTKGIILETAHPVKFPEAVKQATGGDIEVPASLGDLMQQPKQAVAMPPDYDAFKAWLTD